MVLRRIIVFTLFLLFLAAAPVWAVTTDIPDLPRIESAVKIDGNLDDDAWRQALQIQINTETNPGENIRNRSGPVSATDRTFFLKVGYAWTP